MELLEFKEKVFEILDCKKTTEIGNKLLSVVLESDSIVFDKFKDILSEDKDWLQALWQYYEADRTEKKQDYTPKSLCKLVSALAGDCKSVYDCCGGSGALSIQIAKSTNIENVYVEELDENVIPFLLFNLCLNNAAGFVVNGNVLTKEKRKAYRLLKGTKYSEVVEIEDLETLTSVENIPLDVSISNPPYNIKWQPPTPLEMDNRFPVIPLASNANYAFVLHCLHRTTDKAILILPNGVISQRTENEVRKYLVDNDLIETVISLPSNMFECTNIATCIMVLNKQKKKNKGKVNLIYSVENCITKERDQNGQFGGKSHTNRTYKKKYNVLSDENIQKILDVIENQQEIKQFSVIKTNEEIAEKKYMLAPSMYIEIDIEDFTDTQHRDFQEIADNINYISRMQNACKLVINETLAKKFGIDKDLYNQSKESSERMREQMKSIGVNIEIEDFIQFTKNKNEFIFKCNDKELLPDILPQFLMIWKNQIALLNTMQNQYLSELRDALLPDLMSGKIEL